MRHVDRRTVYGGESPNGPTILETIDAITGSIAFAIDPAHRREGLASSMIRRPSSPSGSAIGHCSPDFGCEASKPITA